MSHMWVNPVKILLRLLKSTGGLFKTIETEMPIGAGLPGSSSEKRSFKDRAMGPPDTGVRKLQKWDEKFQGMHISFL